jgi:MFS family permease
LQKLPVGKFLSVTTIGKNPNCAPKTENVLMEIVWGGLLMTTPACHNFAGIAINRFLLGMVEAVVTPGFVLMMGMWYTTEEQPLRLEAWYCTNGIATMFGG